MKKAQPSSGGFRLPSDISFQKEYGPAGWVYTFRHQELGQLGRILLQGLPGGRCQVTSEISGDPDDHMTEKRTAIFGPVAIEIARQMDLALGGTGSMAQSEPIPPYKKPPKEFHGFHSKHMQCEKCGDFVAVLIFTDEAKDASGLEDCARLMFPKVKEWNLPTWVIGPSIGDGPPPERPAQILKIWPKRESIQILRPDEFNPIIDELASSHCR